MVISDHFRSFQINFWIILDHNRTILDQFWIILDHFESFLVISDDFRSFLGSFWQNCDTSVHWISIPRCGGHSDLLNNFQCDGRDVTIKAAVRHQFTSGPLFSQLLIRFSYTPTHPLTHTGTQRHTHTHTADRYITLAKMTDKNGAKPKEFD